MDFYLNASVSGLEETQKIIKDFLYWFNGKDKAVLYVFSTGNVDMTALKRTGYEYANRPRIVYIDKKVKSEDLHKYYCKPVLVNEIVNYEPGDLFRIYKLVHPMAGDRNFDNQPISIQYDIAYDITLGDDFRGYFPYQTAAIKDAIEYYKPSSILDCGCGAGANYYYLKESLEKYGTDYTGIDLSRFQLIKAIDRYARTGKAKVSFELLDLSDIPFEVNSFDFAFSESTLPFVRKSKEAVLNMDKVSKNGFFASFYTLERKYKNIPYDKKNRCYLLDTGSTWKFMNSVTPNTFYLPEFSHITGILKNLDSITIRVNEKDQFFSPLGVKTKNVFVYPKSWYESRSGDFKDWNFRPLM